MERLGPMPHAQARQTGAADPVQSVAGRGTGVRRLVGLQYLRGAAATAVVVLHAGRTGWDFHAGEAGVDLFFVLSGFLMVAITGPETRPLGFLADRLRRIVPVYWIATGVVLAGALAGFFPNLRLQADHVVASFLFVPWRSPSDGHPWPLLVPGWTLNYEMAFYLLFAASIPLGTQRRQAALLTALFVALVACGILFHPAGAIAATYTDPMLLEFIGGCWVGLSWKRRVAWPGWLGKATMLLALAAILVGATLVSNQYRAATYGLPAVLLLASVLAIERRKAIGIRRLPLFIGDASYSIYLWHVPAVSATLALCGRLSVPSLAATVAGVLGGTAAGAVGYLAIEEPMLRYFRERRQIRGVPLPTAP